MIICMGRIIFTIDGTSEIQGGTIFPGIYVTNQLSRQVDNDKGLVTKPK
jgi:hypothetical protein